MVAQTGEKVIKKMVENTKITTEDNVIVICALGFIQGDEESTTTTTTSNFYDTDWPDRTEGAIKNNNGDAESTNTMVSFNIENTNCTKRTECVFNKKQPNTQAVEYLKGIWLGVSVWKGATWDDSDRLGKVQDAWSD